jgi:putative membrane protein insertion efficiency factor
MRRLAVGLVRLYQAGISPLLPAACRFTPTCSNYALAAIERFGVAKGGWLALRRIMRCHPFGGRGYDPVPPAPGGRTRGGRGMAGGREVTGT